MSSSNFAMTWSEHAGKLALMSRRMRTARSPVAPLNISCLCCHPGGWPGRASQPSLRFLRRHETGRPAKPSLTVSVKSRVHCREGGARSFVPWFQPFTSLKGLNSCSVIFGSHTKWLLIWECTRPISQNEADNELLTRICWVFYLSIATHVCCFRLYSILLIPVWSHGVCSLVNRELMSKLRSDAHTVTNTNLLVQFLVWPTIFSHSYFSDCSVIEGTSVTVE